MKSPFRAHNPVRVLDGVQLHTRMDTLINLLDKHHRANINKDENLFSFLTNGRFDELPKDIQDIVLAANRELIKDGRPNMARIRALFSAGYDITPGEVDSFGWLSGMIHTRTGIIVFG